MPKLSQRTLADIKRYIPLRFSHKSNDWIKVRIRHVIRALKKETLEAQDNYSDKVDEFFKINEQVLIDAEANGKGELHPSIAKSLSMDTDEMIKLVTAHGGNVNAAMDSLNGNNNKQY